MTLPADLQRIADAISARVPPDLTEDFGVDLVVVAVTDDLVGDFDRDEIAAWTVEGAPFSVWPSEHLRTLKRCHKAYVTRQRKTAEARRTIETGERPEPSMSAAMRKALKVAEARKVSNSEGPPSHEGPSLDPRRCATGLR